MKNETWPHTNIDAFWTTVDAIYARRHSLTQCRRHKSTDRSTLHGVQGQKNRISCDPVFVMAISSPSLKLDLF